MFVSGAVSGQGAAGPVPGLASGSVPVSVSGPGTPRKFSEKIAMLTQRQAEDTAAFREVMMDITATRLQVQRARQVRGQGSDYGGSLPNVNQTGGPADLQGRPTCGPDAGAATRRPPIGEWNQGDGRVSFPLRPIRRHTSSPYRSALFSPTSDPCCRRNLCSISQHLQPPITALNRTNSDSALHTSLRNTHTGGHLSPTHTFRNRHSVFLYPAPPIEENVVEEGKLSWSHRKAPASPSGNKSVIPGISVLLSPDLHVSGSLLGFPSSLSASGSLPDLSCLHLPSPQPPPKHHKEEPLSVCSKEDDCPLPGLSSSLQGSLSNPLLPASLSNPNIQTSLSSHSLPASLRSASLDLSLSNPSLQSCPSNQSLQSFFSNSSLSSQSIQSAASVCSYSSGIGGSRSCSSSSLSCSPRQAGQSQASVVRRRAPLSPLVVPIGGESRCHHFSPVGSPTLSPITQGVLLDTNQLPKELRPAGFSLSQSHLHLQARSESSYIHIPPDPAVLHSQAQVDGLPLGQPPAQPNPLYPHTQCQPQTQPRLRYHHNQAQAEVPSWVHLPAQHGGPPPQHWSVSEGSTHHRNRQEQQNQKLQQNYCQQRQSQQWQHYRYQQQLNQQHQHQQQLEHQPVPPHQLPSPDVASPHQDKADRLSHQQDGQQPLVHSQIDLGKQPDHQQQVLNMHQQDEQRDQEQNHFEQENTQEQKGHYQISQLSQHLEQLQQQQNQQTIVHPHEPQKSGLQQPHRPQHQLGHQEVPKPCQQPQGPQHQQTPYQQQYHQHHQLKMSNQQFQLLETSRSNFGSHQHPHHDLQQQQPQLCHWGQSSQQFHQSPLCQQQQSQDGRQPQQHSLCQQQQIQDGGQFQQYPLCQQQQIQDGGQFQQYPLCQQQQIQDGGQFQQYPLCQQQQIQDGGQFQQYPLCQQEQSQDGGQFQQPQLFQQQNQIQDVGQVQQYHQQQVPQYPQDSGQFLPQHGCQFPQQQPSHQPPAYSQAAGHSLDFNKRTSGLSLMPRATGPRLEPTRGWYQNQSQQGKSWTQQRLQAQRNQNQITGGSLDTGQGFENECVSVMEPLQHRSYQGLHLTPSQTDNLAHQLVELSKTPGWAGRSRLSGGDQDPAPSIQRISPTQLLASSITGCEGSSACLSARGFESESWSLEEPGLDLDPLGLEELSMLADGHLKEHFHSDT